MTAHSPHPNKAVPPGPSTAHDALDLHLQLLRWCQQPQPQRERVRLEHGAGWQDPPVEQLARELGSAWTLWLPEMMHTPISQSARTIPPPSGLLDPDIIPTPSGILIAGGPPLSLLENCDRTGSRNLPAGVRAISWQVQAITRIDDDDGSAWTVPSVRITPWVVGRHVRHPVPEQATDFALGPAAAQMVTTDPDERHRLEQASISAPWLPPEEDWASSNTAIQLCRWMLTVWVWTTDVLPRWIVPAHRSQRRRAQRLWPDRPEWGDIHVTALRRREPPPGSSAQASGEHATHRWIVRGHWRWQACGPRLSQRRLTWIQPHVKGPEGAPLIELDQVGKLVR